MALLDRYDVPVPRYTSYPTVPVWQESREKGERWLEHAAAAYRRKAAISLYLHLPYCESLCTYCGCNKHITKNHLVERPYLEALLLEWEQYRQVLGSKPVIRELHLGGGTPTFFSPENLSWFMRELRQRATFLPEADLSFEAHPSSTTAAHLEALREVGFNRLSLGVQDFDQKILATIHRFQTDEQITNICSKARSLGYRSINFDLIYGLPGQTGEHIELNFERVASLKPDRIAFYSYAHVPGVAPSQRAYSEADLPSPEEKYALYQQGQKALRQLGYQHIGMDHFALPKDDLSKSARNKTLHRNFMGYTPAHTELSIGLGASAISDSWTAFAQNEKKIKDYLYRVRKQEKLPVFKHHFLTLREQATRKMLLELICHFQLDELDQPWRLSAAQEQELLQMEKDGLLKRFPRQIKVTERGRGYIRNICALFDFHYQAQKGKGQFSRAI